MDHGIDAVLVRHIAHLSRLAMSDAEIAQMVTELSAIVEYIDQLSELDTTDVAPTVHALPVHNIFRSDKEGTSFGPEESLANAPQRQGEFFRVPKMVRK